METQSLFFATLAFFLTFGQRQQIGFNLPAKFFSFLELISRLNLRNCGPFSSYFLYSLTLHPDAWSSQCLIQFLRGGRDPPCVSMRPGSSDQNKSRTNLRPALTPLLPALGCKNSFHCCLIDICNCLSSDNLKHFNSPLLLALRCRNSYQCRCNPFELTFATAFLR